MLTGLFSMSVGNVKKQFARKCVAREKPKLWHYAILLENTTVPCIHGRSKLLGRRKDKSFPNC